jgi:hypothetical protein
MPIKCSSKKMIHHDHFTLSAWVISRYPTFLERKLLIEDFNIILLLGEADFDLGSLLLTIDSSVFRKLSLSEQATSSPQSY